MSDYSTTKARIFQWVGIVLVLAVFAGAYWYFKVYGSTLNQSQNDLVTNGLVGLWSFNGDDMSGTTAYDRSGSGNNGTLTAGPTIVMGKVGQALNFDGSDDRVSMGNALDFERTASFTISAWIKLPSATPSTVDTFVSKVGTGNVGYTISIRGDVANDPVEFELRGSSTYLSLRSDQIWVANKWTHLVWTYDGSITAAGMKLYRDGVLQRTTTVDATLTTQIISNTGNFLVGAFSASSNPFLGAIDEVRVYNRVLSANETQSLYAQGGGTKSNTSVSQPGGTGRLDSGLTGYWKLDDGTSGATPTTAADASTNGVTGTLTGSPTWTTGQIGNGVDLDGTNDYIDIGRSAITSTNALTVSAWAKFGSNRDSFGHPIFGNVNGQSGSDGHKFAIDNSGTYNIYGFAGGTFVATTIIPSLDTWYHFVNTFDGVTERIYVNGQLAYSGAGTLTQAAENNVYLGAHVGPGSTTYMDGVIDEARVYARALSQDEVSWLYNLTAPTPVDTSLKGYWSFNGQDMNGTTAYDRSGAGNTGTLTNGPTKTVGKLSQALNFDGSDDYVDAGTASAVQSLDQLSVASWVYIANYPVAGDDYVHAIVSTQTDSGTLSGWTLSLGSYGIDAAKENIYFEFRNVGNTAWRASIVSSTELSLNTWYHIVTTYDQANIKVYVNGMLESSSPQTEAIANGVGLSIGRKYAGSAANRNWDGKLDETRIYGRALSAAEIKSLYDVGADDKFNSSVSQPQGTGRLDSGLAGYWKLDDGSGTSATDNSTNGNTGTLTNDPTWGTGQVGSAVTFDGTNDYINVPDPSSGVLDFGTNSFSVSIWFKTASTTSKRLMNKINATPTGWLFDVNTTTGGTDSAGDLRFGIRDSSTLVDYAVPLSLNDNSWHLATATVDRGNAPTLKIYADGILVGSTSLSSVTGSIDNAEPFALGVVPSALGNYYSGQLDEARVYNRALSDDEVAQLYRLNAPTGIDTGLKGYWSFNGKDMLSSTTFADRSGAGNTATLVNGPAKTIGKLGQALNLDGSDDYVSVADSASLDIGDTDDLSLSGWFYRDTFASDHTIIAKRNGIVSTDTGYIAYIDDTTDQLIFEVSDGTDEYSLTSVSTFTTTGWNHYAIVWDQDSATNSEIYINGVANSATDSGTIGNIGDLGNALTFRMGAESDNGNPFDGKTDEVRVYKRALTAAEIASLYNASR